MSYDQHKVRFDSWKEIAAYLGRTVRTVQRWEHEGLPVQRHAHNQAGSVYADKTDIDIWRARRRVKLETANEESGDFFQLSEHHRKQRTLVGLRKSIHYAELAVARDRNFGPAHARLGLALTTLAAQAAEPPTPLVERARQSIAEALRLDPTLLEAHLADGFNAFGYDWNWNRAETIFERLRSRWPADGFAIQLLALLKVVLKDEHGARELVGQAHMLEPLSPRSGVTMSVIHWLLRDYEQAMRTAEAVVDLEPFAWQGWMQLACVRLEIGQPDEALAAVGKAVALESEHSALHALCAECEGRCGRTDAALGSLNALTRTHQYITHYWLARAYVWAGDRRRAFTELDESIREREGYLVYLGHDPGFDPIRQDPDFRLVMRRVGLPE